jgi:hypothetical protein
MVVTKPRSGARPTGHRLGQGPARAIGVTPTGAGRCGPGPGMAEVAPTGVGSGRGGDGGTRESDAR